MVFVILYFLDIALLPGVAYLFCFSFLAVTIFTFTILSVHFLFMKKPIPDWLLFHCLHSNGIIDGSFER